MRRWGQTLSRRILAFEEQVDTLCRLGEIEQRRAEMKARGSALMREAAAAFVRAEDDLRRTLPTAGGK